MRATAAIRTTGVWLSLTLFASGIAGAAPPPLEVLGFGGRGDTDMTRLWALSPSSPPREIGRVHHRAGASVKGSLLADRRVVAVAERSEARERSWTGALYLVDAVQSEPLLNDVYEGSWPVVVDATRVLVARGEAGPTLLEAQRVDNVYVDQFDVATKKVKRVYQSVGYLALPIGELRGVVYVADYGPAGVSLVAIDRAGTVRVVATELLLARDFSLDAARGVVYAQVRHAEQRDRWQAIEIDVTTGQKRALLDSAHYGMVPRRWPGGEWLALNPTADGGLHLLRLRDRAVVRAPFAPSFGTGADELAALSSDGRGAAILHHHGVRDVDPTLWLVDLRSNRGLPIALPPKELRFEIVGVVSAEVRR